MKVQDERQYIGEYPVRAIGIVAVLAPLVVTVLIAASEALPKVVSVVFGVQVVATVSVGGILEGVTRSIVGPPMIVTVGRPGPKAFLVTVVDGASQEVDAVLIGFVVATTAIVAIGGRSVEVGVAIVVVTFLA